MLINALHPALLSSDVVMAATELQMLCKLHWEIYINSLPPSRFQKSSAVSLLWAKL